MPTSSTLNVATRFGEYAHKRQNTAALQNIAVLGHAFLALRFGVRWCSTAFRCSKSTLNFHLSPHNNNGVSSRGWHSAPRDLAVEVPNPKTQIPGKVSKYPNSNGRHQLLWELKPWDFLGIWCLGFGISIVRSLTVCAVRDDPHSQLPRGSQTYLAPLSMLIVHVFQTSKIKLCISKLFEMTGGPLCRVRKAQQIRHPKQFWVLRPGQYRGPTSIY